MAISNFLLTIGAPKRASRESEPAGSAAAACCAACACCRSRLAARCTRLTGYPALWKNTVGVGAVAMLMSKDLKQSSAMLRRNMRHVRTWLEEQGAAAE